MNTNEKRINSFLGNIEGWKSVLDSSSDLIAILDTEFKVIWVNKAMVRKLDTSPDSCLGLKCFEAVHGTESPIPNCPHAKMILNGQEYTEEVNEENLGGCFIVTASPIKDESGNVLGSIHIARDIRERKKAEEKIQNLANVVESSDDAIITKSIEGTIISWNKGAEYIYGYSAEEIFGKPISILEPSQLGQETKELINKIKSGERIDHYETLRLRKDGTLINVSVTLSPVFDASGELVAISAISRDITERKKVEELNQKLLGEVQQFAKELEVSNEELQATTEELQVTNEELQNTTEELQVANEELRQQGEDLAYLNQELRESEQRVRLKLESILSPEGDIKNLDLGDIIDTPAIQSLMDDFYKLTSIPIGVIDLNGNVLVGVGWQDICTKFHRIHPETYKHCIESDTQLSEGVPPGEFKLYKCKNNMWDIATPIIIGNQHFGNIFLGQFFFDDEEPDYELFQKQARKYGFNEEEYINALKNVPRLSRDTVDESMAFFMKLANLISDLSYSNIKLAKSLTERDTLMDSLRESEQRMNRSQEIGHIGSWELDLVNNHLFWSDEVYKLFGLQPQEFGANYEAFLESIHPDDRGAVDAAYSGSLQEGRDTYEIEHRVVRKSTGEVRIVYEKCEHIKDESGQIIRSVGMVHDITERKQAEDALKESEKRYRELLENSFDAVIIHIEGKVVFANSAAERILGAKKQDEFIDTHVFDFVHPDYKKVVAKRIQKMLEDNIIVPPMEQKFIRIDGESIYVEVIATPFNYNGKKAVQVVFRNIDDRKKAEKRNKELLEEVQQFAEELQVSNEELQNITVELQVANEELKQQGKDMESLNQALQESKEHYQQFFDNPLNGFALCEIITNDNGEPVDFVYLKVNDAFEEFTGLKKEDVLNKKVSDVLPIEEVAPAVEIYGKVALTGKSEQFEISIPSLDKTYDIVAFSPRKMQFIAMFTDITQHKKIEETILWNQQRNELLAEVSSRLLTSENPQDIVDDLCQKTMEFLECNVFFNYLVDKQEGRLHLNAYSGIPEEEAQKIEWLDYGVAVCGCTALESRRIIAENIFETPDSRTDLVKSYGVQAYACHPLVIEDRTIGTLSFGTNSRTKFTDKELDVMKAVTDQISIAMNRLISNHILKESEEAAIQARKEWEQTFEAVPDLIAILGTDYKVVRANKAMADRFDITPEECVGLTCYKVVHGMDEPPSFCPHQQLLKDGFEHTEEVHEDSLGGDFLVSATPLHNSEGKLIGSVHVARNITERKRKEKELYQLNKAYKVLSSSSQAMISAKSELEYLESVCNMVVEDCGHSMVWIGYAEADEDKTVRPVAHAGFDDGYIESLNVTWADNEYGNGPTGTAIRTQKPSMCKNMLTDLKFKPWREAAIKRGYVSSLVLPLVFDGKVLGAISIYSTELNPFSEDEVKLLTELAANLAYGINVIRLRIAREQMEEALVRSENEFRTLAENSPDAIARFDKQHRHIYVNPAAAEPYSLPQEEIIGKTHNEIEIDPEKTKFWERHHEKVFTTGKPETMEFQYISPQGVEYYYNTQIVPEFVDGEVKSILAISRDITYIKEAEAELKEARDNLEEQVKERTLELAEAYESLKLANAYNRSLIEASIDPLVTIGPDGKITDANYSTEQATGYSKDEIINTDFSDYFTEPEKARDGYQEVFREGKVFDYPLKIKHRDGHVTPVLYNASVYRDDSGDVIGVFAAARDITELKKAEKEIEFAGKYNRSLIEASLDPLVTIGPDGKITDVNHSTEAATGYSRDELIGTDFSDYFIEPEKAREGYQHVFQEGIVRDYPLEIQHKNGYITPVLYNASVYEDESGDVIGVFAAARDITEQKKAEKMLKLKLEELARSNAELEQFAYVSSHDLQEPLRMIGSYLQLLQRKYQGELDENADKYINFAVDGATRMQNLINDLLAFSRVTTQAKKFESTDCEFILDQVLSNLEISIKENEAIISHDHLPKVMADSTQLIQVFQNLLSNAIKFRSEKKPEIHISAKKEGNKWLFSVADNGIGIDPKHSKRIFEVFKRLHKRREYPGTGIGLSICKKIVERHGGRIWVESEPNKGSIFYFILAKS